MQKKHKNILTFSILAIFIIALITLLIFVKPTEIVGILGIKNAYILTFFVSLFGGFSAGGSVSFISLLVTFTLGGLNPIYLGIIAGIALTIGDIIMFYFGSKGRELIEGKWDKKLIKLAKLFEKKKWLKKMTPFLAYLYIGLTPFPNDILLFFLAAIKYPAKKMNIIILLGDLTFPLMVTLLTARGIILFV